jgi:uncharacterized protein (UPF0332 family)
MPFPDDLLELAGDLSLKDSRKPKQASLRRAVSTSYYAVFHLLIEEAVSQWAVERQRSILARTFEHSRMKAVCDDLLKTAKSGGAVQPELITVSRNFIELQEHRNRADYDLSKEWSLQEVFNVVDLAGDGFTAWRAIHTQDAAQDFLLRLFLPRPPRP